MKVWIDQDRCTGDGQCADICPEIFFMHEDGRAYRAYVREVGMSGFGPDGLPELHNDAGMAVVPRSLETCVVEAAADCPGECIIVDEAAGNDPWLDHVHS